MEQKLTAQIAACYPNALIKTANFTCKMVGICFDTNELVLRATGGVITDCFVHPVVDCQLLLHPLSAITDEHAIEVAKICDNGYIGKRNPLVIKRSANTIYITTGQCDDVSCIRIDKHILRIDRIHEDNPENSIAQRTMQRLLDLLRPLSYDLGHSNTPSLIAAGIAVDKSKM